MKLKSTEVFNFVINNEVDKLEEYLKNGGDPELKNDFKQTLLMVATWANKIEISKLLLKYKADVNTRDYLLDTPFIVAGGNGYHEMVSLYLKHNPRFDIFNRFGGSALIPACERTHNKTVKILVNTPGFPINHVNKLGWTALIETVLLAKTSKEQIETVRLLVEAGADPNITDPQGATALQRAIDRGYTEIIEILEKVTTK